MHFMNLLGLEKHRFIVLAIVFCGSMLAAKPVSAQLRDYLNLPDHDSKRFYIGISFMYEQSHLQVTSHPQFLQHDSVLSVNPGNSGGFGVSGAFTLRVANHLELRLA